MSRLLFAVLLLLGACASTTVEFEPLATPLPDDTAGVEELAGIAADLCLRHAWVGIAEPGLFPAEAAELGVEPARLTHAVRAECPDTFYEPLSKAEVDWCGDGRGFGQNFFLVIEAGLDLGIESFTVVEPGLLAKARSRSAELDDYEVELLTAELQTMTESSRFERDWAAACRSTF